MGNSCWVAAGHNSPGILGVRPSWSSRTNLGGSETGSVCLSVSELLGHPPSSHCPAPLCRETSCVRLGAQHPTGFSVSIPFQHPSTPLGAAPCLAVHLGGSWERAEGPGGRRSLFLGTWGKREVGEGQWWLTWGPGCCAHVVCLGQGLPHFRVCDPALRCHRAAPKYRPFWHSPMALSAPFWPPPWK